MPGVGEIGEFGLIERIKARRTAYDEDVVVGIGDDAAVLRRGNVLEVLTTDCLVAGSHYEVGWLGMGDVGWKSLAVNVSDVAAMGGIPKHAVATLFLPEDYTVAELDDLYDGLDECASETGVSIVGGDIVKTVGPFAISVALAGVCERDEVVLRSGAREGDIIVVTGSIGDAAVGLRCIRDGVACAEGGPLVSCVERFKRPVARLKESRVIVQELQPSSMIDISDGLLSDMWHILEASRVGAVLEAEKVPVGQCVIDFFKGDREDALSHALAGGEDYELLFTTSSRFEDKLAAISSRIGTGLTAIGKVTGKTAQAKIVGAGREVDLKQAGFDHFRRREV